MEDRWIPTYCYQCNSGGPDLLKVHVVDGVAVDIGPNDDYADVHPAGAKVCIKAYGLINKHYNPHRIKGPMKRTNPQKGIDEDPKFVDISWEEAINTWAEKLLAIKEKGLTDDNGYYRVNYAEGSDGVCPAYVGTLPVIFGGLQTYRGAPPGIFGGTDFSVGQGGGVKCYHSEHLFGELWHKSFQCVQDTRRCNYLIAFGKNDLASGGVIGAYRQAEAKERGCKRIQIEPHLSVTGAASDEWIPIRPETDHAFLFAMIHVILHEMNWQKVCDIEFLKTMTNSPYLVGSDGYFVMDAKTMKPLVWDSTDDTAKPFDEDVKDFALDGKYEIVGTTIGPDGKNKSERSIHAQPSFALMRQQVQGCTPEWAANICDVPAATIRRLAQEFIKNAQVGATVTIDEVNMPLRPVCIMLGKSVNNGWGARECIWGAHVLQILVGALEVPGSHLGSRVIFSGSPKRTHDGFFEYPFSPMDKDHWRFPPGRRDGVPSLCPLTGPFMGANHLAWKWLLEPPANWPAPSIPEMFITYKINPVISQFDTPAVITILSKIPFHVAFGYTVDETVWFADLVLPEDGDLEAMQIFPVGGTPFYENQWEYMGYAIKQPVVKRLYNTKNITDIATDLAHKLGMLATYNEAINNGAYLGIALKGTLEELKPERKYSAEEIYDRMCRRITKRSSSNAVEHGLDEFKQIGAFFVPFPKLGAGLTMGPMWLRPWYIYPYMKENGIRFELPYQERFKRLGEELKARLQENNITWWDHQINEYQGLPEWQDITKFLDEVTINRYGKNPKDYPFWLLTGRSMQYAWGANIGVPMMHEVASHVLGHTWLQMNAKAAQMLGINDEEEVWIESPYARIRGRIKLREGIRPDVILTTQMYGHSKTPFAKDFKLPNLNQLAPALIELTDECGGSKDHVRVQIYK